MHPRLPLAVILVLVAAGGVLAQDARVADARRALTAANAQETQLAERIGRNRAELARMLGALQLFGRDPPPALLASAGDVKDAVRAAILIKAITPALQTRARALAAESARLSLVRRRAAAASGDLFAAESAQEDRRSRLDGVMTDAEVLSPPSTRTVPVPGQPAAPKEQPPRNLLTPAAGERVAGFGGRLLDGARSQGLAIRPAAGAAVISPAAAVVDYAGPLNGWGEVLILRASGGCHMVLSGLGKISVTAGQSVAAGQTVGTMTTDGHSSRELYFEVRMGGAPVNPAKLMAGTPLKTASGGGHSG